jgi:hypothetical protein
MGNVVLQPNSCLLCPHKSDKIDAVLNREMIRSEMREQRRTKENVRTKERDSHQPQQLLIQPSNTNASIHPTNGRAKAKHSVHGAGRKVSTTWLLGRTDIAHCSHRGPANSVLQMEGLTIARVWCIGIGRSRV